MSPDDGNERPGLAWPDHDTGPAPPPEYKSRERDEDRATRKPLEWWDRLKFLILLGGLWLALVWGNLASNPIMPFRDALNLTVRSGAWVLILGGLEILRQIHFLISERSAGYHKFWTEKVFGGFSRRANLMKDWNRFRVSRAFKWLFWLAIIDLVLAKLLHEPAAIAFFKLPVIIYRALPTIIQAVLIISLGLFQIVLLYWFLSKGGVDVYYPDDVKTRFSDVWGQDHVLARIKENMVFLEDPESIEEKGGYVPGGILLWGPPGTGKTLMAESVAGETGKPFVFVDPGAFIQMFMGVGILKVKALYRKLRKLALRYGGVIVFFDEADSLGNRGMMPQGGGPWGGSMTAGPWASDPACNGLSYLSQDTVSLLFRARLEANPPPEEPRRRVVDRIFFGGFGGGMGTLQALLTEMSGLKKPRGFFNRRVRRALGMRPKPPPKYRILQMFATNMPAALDEAMLRPGRIDRIYKVGYPSKAGRVRTYEGYFAKVKHELTSEEIEKLAVITPYATGATIKDLVNESLIFAIRNGRDTISWSDVMKAKLLKDLGPPEDVEYIERERHAVAIHEACHAVVAYRARHHLTIDVATIEKGGTYLGMVASIKPEDQFTHWRSEHEADIMVSLASLAGERMFFEDSTSGVSGDLESATGLATLMEGFWGMGSTVASHGVTHAVGIGGGGKPGKEKGKEAPDLEGGLGVRIERNLEVLLKRTTQLLEKNRAAVLAVAHALEANKTLTGEDVEAVIDGRPGPLVDGRPYQTTAFLRSSEAYHAAAVEAHKSHSQVKVSLPDLPVLPLPVSGDGTSGNGEVAEAPALSPNGDPTGDGKGSPVAEAAGETSPEVGV